MPRTIYFRVGSSNHITLADFVDSLKNFLGILRDLDAAVSEDGRATAKWEVTTLKKESPPLVGVTPLQINNRRLNMGEAVEIQIITNIHDLTLKGERTEKMSDAALLKLKYIARKTKNIGNSSVFMNGDGAQRETTINETTLERVADLTDAKYSAFGFVKGKLEAVSVHKGNEFRVWDIATGKPVRCGFDPELLEKVKTLLTKSVTVSGVIHANRAGVPIKMDLEDLSLYEETELPSIEQMSGLVKDFTSGRSLKEFLEDEDE